MFPRSTEAAAEGAEGHDLLFGEGIPYALLGMGMCRVTPVSDEGR
ncbi:hypothetical protein GCM10022255_087730 [Dactylosporangium darangshiense]|uniref:Uncharacterized protein n=1 Tax=Dactylosporangium darangshiense TaxID=579108 RepID=A0ABP8DN67_9ACTN